MLLVYIMGNSKNYRIRVKAMSSEILFNLFYPSAVINSSFRFRNQAALA